MNTIMVPYHSHFGGQFVARCPACDTVCAYWEDDDLDEDGNLVCHCDETED